MANPNIISITSGGWVKVATNVTTGFIHQMSNIPIYLQTYRVTGDPAPTAKSEGVLMFINDITTETISSSSAIDIYLWCDEDGSVRVDL